MAVSKSTDLFEKFTGIAVLKFADAFFKAEITQRLKRRLLLSSQPDRMLSAVLAAVLHAQITVLSPTDLLPRLPHTTGYVVVSFAHTDEIVDAYLAHVAQVFAQLGAWLAEGAASCERRLEGPVKHSGPRRV